MRQNQTKRNLQAGRGVLGLFATIPSPELIEIWGYLGFDFVVIDAEHGPINEIVAANMIRAAEVAGITPLVRVPQNQPAVILRFLDVGAQGVMVPQVNSREEAENVVKAVKYYPQGRRGMATARAGEYGLKTTTPEYMAAANRETLVVVQIENVAGVENLAEILRVEGVDVAFVGPADLSQSLGVPAQWDAPVLQQTIAQVLAETKRAGRVAGMMANDAATINKYFAQGVLFLMTWDGALVAAGGRELLRGVKR